MHVDLNWSRGDSEDTLDKRSPSLSDQSDWLLKTRSEDERESIQTTPVPAPHPSLRSRCSSSSGTIRPPLLGQVTCIGSFKIRSTLVLRLNNSRRTRTNWVYESGMGVRLPLQFRSSRRSTTRGASLPSASRKQWCLDSEDAFVWSSETTAAFLTVLASTSTRRCREL